MQGSQTKPKGKLQTKNDKKSSSSRYLSKHRDRKNYILELSVVPVLICFVAFGKSAIYRIFYSTPPQCRSFGWYSSSSGEFQCDYKPLDIHATLALLWLATFSIQVTLMAAGKPNWHKLFGKLGLTVAFANAAGMFWLAIQDILNPMEKTDRPSDFTPFMFLVAVKLTVCLIFSTQCILPRPGNPRDVEGHMIWMFRGFITSFTTPVIRFYPMVLRLLAGDDCFDENREKFVMGAMFVSELVSVLIYSLAQLKTQPVFWDTFMRLQLVTFLIATMKEMQFASTHGLFLNGMLQCGLQKAFSSYA